MDYIPSWAFLLSKIEKYEIPYGVNTIKDNAFDGSNLKSIKIPKSIKSINFYAFNDCTSLTDVYYKGSKEDWKKIDIWRGNKSLLKADIHYNS